MGCTDCKKEGITMTMLENYRFIKGLRKAGWTEKEINDFMMYIESGEEEYEPKPRDNREYKGE